MKQATIYDGDIVEQSGFRFRVTFEPDYDAGMPWENADGHGPVRRSNNRHHEGDSDKQPGERPLNQPDRHEYQFYYDWREACKIAKRDGWNTEPYDAPNQVQRAVQSDFDYLRRFLADDWQYVLVSVQRVDADDNDIGDAAYLGCVETSNNYDSEAAREMIDEMVSSIRRENAAKGLETKRRNYWAARDVLTI